MVCLSGRGDKDVHTVRAALGGMLNDDFTTSVEQAKVAGHKAFIPYIMAGDGGLETIKPTILKLQQLEVTAIEVGIPFTILSQMVQRSSEQGNGH